MPEPEDDLVGTPAERAWARYVARFRSHRKAVHADQQHRAQIAWLRRMIDTIDMAMEDEGIGPRSRERVIRTVLYGAPDPDAALARVEEHEQLVREMAMSPGPIRIDLPGDLLAGQAAQDPPAGVRS